jgi:hypothetical protein
MYAQTAQAKENKSSVPSNGTSPMKLGLGSRVQLLDNRPQAVKQRKIQEMTNNSSGQSVTQRAAIYKKSVAGLPHWEVTALDAEAGQRYQIGFANPRALTDTSGSVATKSGSPSGFGGEGEVRWTALNEGTQAKGGYTRVVQSNNGDADDGTLLPFIPRNGTRRTYRLTSNNCQHFVSDAWDRAGLAPAARNYLTIGKETGSNVNSGLIGGGLGLLGAVMLGGAAVASLPALGAGLVGAGIGMGINKMMQ